MKDTGIGPGTTVRLKSSASKNLREKMSRWVVVSTSTQTCVAQDTEEDSIKTLRLEDLEIVKNGYALDDEVSSPEEDETDSEMYWGEDGFVHFADELDEEGEYIPLHLRAK
jgi:hypothetical protein